MWNMARTAVITQSKYDKFSFLFSELHQRIKFMLNEAKYKECRRPKNSERNMKLAQSHTQRQTNDRNKCEVHKNSPRSANK